MRFKLKKLIKKIASPFRKVYSHFRIIISKIKKSLSYFIHQTRGLSYLVDCLLLTTLLILLVFGLLSTTSFKIPGTVTTHIVVSLIPSVITIIFFIIQLQNNKIRGIKLLELERLRKGFYYHLLHMSIVVVAIFTFEVVLQVLDLQLCVLVLDSFSILYSIIFLWQEIPVLTRNKRTIDKILNNVRRDHNHGSQDYDSPGQTAITFTILKYGIQECVEKFSHKNQKDEDLINNLLLNELGFYNRVLISCAEKEQGYILIFYRTEHEINLLKAVDISFQDIKYFLIENLNYKYEISKPGAVDIILLTRLTYSLIRVVDKLGYRKKIHEHISTLFNFINFKLYSGDIDSNKHIYQYLLLMLTSTIRDGKTWFIEAVRDVDFSPYFIDPEKNALTFLITMYFCFFTHATYSKEENRKSINEFLNSPSKGINSANISWVEKMKFSLENLNSSKVFLSGVVKMLKIKHLISQGYFEVSPENGGIYSINDSTYFSDELFFDYAIQILMYNHFYDFNEEILDSFLKDLGIDSQTFLNVFETKWNNDENSNKPASFHKFIFQTGTEQFHKNPVVFRVLSNHHQKITKQNYDEDKTNFISREDIEEIKKILDVRMDEIAKSLMFTDENLETEKEKQYFSFLLGNGKDKDLLELYLSHLSDSFSQIVKNELQEKVDSINIFEPNLSEQQINDLIKFSPDYCGNSKLLYDEYFMQSAKVSGKLVPVTNGMLPREMFIKKDSVKIHFKYHPELSIPRQLTTDEVEKIIDRDYTLINGFYRYNKNTGSTIGNFLVTREELSKYLIAKMVYIPIVFSKIVWVDNDNIKYYNFFKEDEQF